MLDDLLNVVVHIAVDPCGVQLGAHEEVRIVLGRLRARGRRAAGTGRRFASGSAAGTGLFTAGLSSRLRRCFLLLCYDLLHGYLSLHEQIRLVDGHPESNPSRQ